MVVVATVGVGMVVDTVAGEVAMVATVDMLLMLEEEVEAEATAIMVVGMAGTAGIHQDTADTQDMQDMEVVVEAMEEPMEITWAHMMGVTEVLRKAKVK